MGMILQAFKHLAEPGWNPKRHSQGVEDAHPESRDSRFNASRCPGM